MDAILNVYKPVGPTSHDVVGTLRRISHQRRVGHAGTLDPAASGVLVVCLGQATRMVEFMVEHDKEYCAEVLFGHSTDTYDATGRPTSPPVEPSFSREELEAAVNAFLGEIEQVPPAFSALKRDGQPLYKLARAGQSVEVAPRRVVVHAIDLLLWEPPRATLRVRCSKGTYIRSLAHDLGRGLGTGAYLDSLVRLASGPFSVDDAATLDELADAFSGGYAEAFAYPLDEAVLGLPAAILSDESVQRVRNGGHWQPTSDTGVGLCRAYTPLGEFAALLEKDDGSPVWRPRKVFGLGG